MQDENYHKCSTKSKEFSFGNIFQRSCGKNQEQFQPFSWLGIFSKMRKQNLHPKEQEIHPSKHQIII